jgi:hypothetical protein
MGQNFQFQIEPFEFDYEMEEEWETDSPDRSSRAFVKWVQQSLNKILGLSLSPDGIMGAQTRSAIRSFQQKRGLGADGIVGAQTEAAIKAALGGAPVAPAKPAALKFVEGFSGPAAECTAALKRAGKTQAEALAIIDAQIAVAIKLLRKAAKDLQQGSRSTATRKLFLKIFRVWPEFVPTWLKPTATIKDRGDVVATRCARVADLLASGAIKFFCAINSTNCPDCEGADPSDFGCSSWGNRRVICLGNDFWDDMKAGNTDSLLATLMHEPFHIYYGLYVTQHERRRPDGTLEPIGKFGGIYCILQFVFKTNGRDAPGRVNDRCADTVVRRELGEFMA